MTKILAFYLPQFHPVKENDKWWGKGYTEWTNVAKARPLFKGHYQPNIPEELGFYDLRLDKTRIEQAELAKEHGVTGFCYWHYWFGNEKRLLEEPFMQVLETNKPDFPFCLAWANHSWERKQWDKEGNSELLIEQLYPGEKDYINHFNKLLPAFKDKRYIQVNAKLLFYIFDPLGSDEVLKFMQVWRALARQNDLSGFHFVARDANSRNYEKLKEIGFDAIYNDDVFNIHHHKNILQKTFHMFNREYLKRPTKFLYRKAIEYMVTDDCHKNDVIPVIAPNWDHSPRSGGRAIILHKPHPKYFKKLVIRALRVVINKPKEEQIIMIKSWNEWGEGNYLEPDLRYGRGYLESLKDAINSENQ